MTRRDSAARMKEIVRLYEIEEMHLQEIADQFGVTQQSIHYFLVKAGVKSRPRGRRKPSLDREVICQIYVEEVSTIGKTAKLLNRSYTSVSKEIAKLGIKKRSSGFYGRKYQELSELKVGETVVIKPTGVKDGRACLYQKARSIGIKISVKILDEERLQIRRVDKITKIKIRTNRSIVHPDYQKNS